MLATTNSHYPALPNLPNCWRLHDCVTERGRTLLQIRCRQTQEGVVHYRLAGPKADAFGLSQIRC